MARVKAPSSSEPQRRVRQPLTPEAKELGDSLIVEGAKEVGVDTIETNHSLETNHRIILS